MQINRKQQLDKIKKAKYSIKQIHSTSKNNWIYTAAISNNLKYIIAGGSDKLLKIWKYRSNDLFKVIKFNKIVLVSKFTEDSQFLFVGVDKTLYGFSVKRQFKKFCKNGIHNGQIKNIFCITDTLLSSTFTTIIKTEINKKETLLKIKYNEISGLDYNKTLNMIAIGSDDGSITLFNGKNGSLIMQKFHALNLMISHVVFIIDVNQLISLDVGQNLIRYKINLVTNQLEQLQLIQNSGVNIFLALQQYIITIDIEIIKVYSINGEFILQFDHEIEKLRVCGMNQHDSMKAILIQGNFKLQVCYIEMNGINEYMKKYFINQSDQRLTFLFQQFQYQQQTIYFFMDKIKFILFSQ